MKRQEERAKVTEVAQEKDQEQLKKQAMQRKQKMLNLRGVIEEGLYYCKHEFNIDPKELSNEERFETVFPHTPFQKGKLAREFLYAVQNNEIKKVDLLL